MSALPEPYEDLSLNDRPGERWAGIAGLEHAFAISDHGRVKRLAHVAPFRKSFSRKTAEKIIVQTKTGSYNAFTQDYTWYLRVSLTWQQKIYNYSVARLVYHAFVAPFDLYDRNLFVFYKDNNSLNVSASNLLIGNQSDKQRRMTESGRRGEPFANITPEQRKNIQQRINTVKAEKKLYQVSRYSLSGKLLETFDNAQVAAKAWKTNASTISKATRSVLLTLKGYLWRRGAEPEIDLAGLSVKAGTNRSPVVKALERLGKYDLEGRLLETYSNIREAARSLKGSESHISAVVNGRKATYKGFLFRWGTKKKIDIRLLRGTRGYRHSALSAKERQVSRYNLDGVWQETYPTVKAAQRATGTDWKSIRYAAVGNNMTAGGYLWRYGTQLRIKTALLTRLPGYRNSALERYHKQKRQT